MASSGDPTALDLGDFDYPHAELADMHSGRKPLTPATFNPAWAEARMNENIDRIEKGALALSSTDRSAAPGSTTGLAGGVLSRLD
ncbi:MAG: hypothetical protein IT381_12600 [Deltaproteobacteria bacterium]|nr:hypothetical protein [Deltaproteobacteria bacterium]